MYKCMNCGKIVDVEMEMTKKIICPFCGYRILKKTRPNVIRKVVSR